MRKRLKKKRASCTLCKPHKMGREKRWKPKEEQVLKEFEMNIETEGVLLICPSVTPYSSIEEIKAWIDELQGYPDRAETRKALEDAYELLRMRKDSSLSRTSGSGLES